MVQVPTVLSPKALIHHITGRIIRAHSTDRLMCAYSICTILKVLDLLYCIVLRFLYRFPAYRVLYLLLSPGISKTNILFITCHILTGLLIPYSNCTPRFIESSMNPSLGISIHTYVFCRFIFYVLVRHCIGF